MTPPPIKYSNWRQNSLGQTPKWFGFPAVKRFKLWPAWLDLTGDGPDKAGEFAGDGSDGDLAFLPVRVRWT